MRRDLTLRSQEWRHPILRAVGTLLTHTELLGVKCIPFVKLLITKDLAQLLLLLGPISLQLAEVGGHSRSAARPHSGSALTTLTARAAATRHPARTTSTARPAKSAPTRAAKSTATRTSKAATARASESTAARAAHPRPAGTSVKSAGVEVLERLLILHVILSHLFDLFVSEIQHLRHLSSQFFGSLFRCYVLKRHPRPMSRPHPRAETLSERWLLAIILSKCGNPRHKAEPAKYEC